MVLLPPRGTLGLRDWFLTRLHFPIYLPSVVDPHTMYPYQ